MQFLSRLRFDIIARMRNTVIAACALLGAFIAAADPVCVDGVCYLSEEDAIAAGVSPVKIQAAKEAHDSEQPPEAEAPTPKAPAPEAAATAAPPPEAPAPKPRVAMGYMKPEEMVAFLRDEKAVSDLEDHSLVVIFILVLLGGLAANLTPCVLPLVPVNLILVGRGWKRGAAYGLGITCAYGALGCAAAFGGMAFGTIQSSPWFSAVAATAFMVLGLAMCGAFFIDLSRFRPRQKQSAATAPGGGSGALRGYGGCFLLGAGAAVLAGACVEPILLATLLLTAKWCAAGKTWAVALPFVLGAGLGLPWPFAAAGLSVLPRPGAWMRWVNRAFALVFFAMAAWYGTQAFRGFRAQSGAGPMDAADGARAATPDTWGAAYAEAKKSGKPVFVDVWATWCKNCLAMEKTTFRDQSVKDALRDFAVVRLQAEDPKAFQALDDFKGLDIKGFPAFVIFTAAKQEK